MKYRSWSGRHSQRCVALTLQTKGTVCHLCGLDGADSADHDPPRSLLMRQGVPDPDALEYLNPAHLVPCNVMRKRKPVTDALKAACLRARRAHLERIAVARTLSPRLAARRPNFLRTPTGTGRSSSPRISPKEPRKNSRNEPRR